MRNFASKAVITLGLIFVLFSLGLFVERFIPTSIKDSKAVEHTSNRYPTSISINSISVNLPIISANRDNGKFVTTKDGVTYLADSILPGETGNSVFYGHNWPSLLGNLKKVKRGDIIQLNYSNGQVKSFIVDLITEMPAKDVNIDTNSEQSILTIYTCSGFLDTKRVIVTANYQGTVL